MAGFAKLVNEGVTFYGKTVKLTANVDLENKVWTPIGNEKAFLGTFDGDGKTVSNLYVTSAGNVGLFGYAWHAEEVKNLTVENASVTGTEDRKGAAVIVGNGALDITNCHVTGDISVNGKRYTGAIAGYFYGDITGCSVTDTTSDGGLVTANFQLGSIVGFMGEGSSTIENCNVENMAVTAKSGGWTGGIVGVIQVGSTVKNNTMTNCTVDAGNANEGYATGLVVGQNIGSADSLTYVINNMLVGTTGTVMGEAMTNIAGTVTDADTTVVGTGVEMDSTGKLLAGTLELLPPEAFLADGTIVKKNSDASFTVLAKSGLKEGTYLSDPTGATASYYYVRDNEDGTWTVYYQAPPAPPAPVVPQPILPEAPKPDIDAPTVDKETTTNSDGSTTVTETKQDGTTVETTTKADGSTTTAASKTEVKETEAGTTTTTATDTSTTTAAGDKVTENKVTETVEKKDGSSTTTVTTSTRTEAADGSTKTEESVKETVVDTNGKETTTSKTETKMDNGSTGTTTVAADGAVTAEVKVTAAAVNSASRNDTAVALPMPSVEAAKAPTVSVSVPAMSASVKVEIPVSDVKPGTVAVMVDKDGNETVIPMTKMSEGGVVLTLSDDVTVKVVDNAKDFSDVSKAHTFSDAAEFASARGIIEGYSNGDFGMAAPATANAAVTVIARTLGNQFYGEGATGEAATWAAEQGLTESLDMSGYVNRETYITILWRASGMPEADVEMLSSFSDGESLSDLGKVAMAWAIEMGLIKGYSDGTVAPGGNISRGAMAAIVQRFIQLD